MILFILGLIALVGCGVCVYLDIKTSINERLIAIICFACIAFSATIVVPQIAVWAGAAEKVVENVQTYEDMKTYAEVMEKSKDEYARAMFYTDVCEWNAQVEAGDDMCDNIWVGSYFPNTYEDCKTITFELSRGETN